MDDKEDTRLKLYGADMVGQRKVLQKWLDKDHGPNFVLDDIKAFCIKYGYRVILDKNGKLRFSK